MRWLLVIGLVGLVSGTALADDARRLRVEAAGLVHAAERAASAGERREFLERAHSKLLEIRERYPSESTQLQLYLHGKRTTLSTDLVGKMIAEVSLAALAVSDVGRLGEVLGRALSPTFTDENAWADLHYAAALNRPDLAGTLLDAGANIASRIKNDGEDISDQLKGALSKLGLDASKPTRWGSTPLHVAAWYNADRVVAELVARGADIHIKDMWGYTPLHEAAYWNAHDVAADLIARGADVNAIASDGKPSQYDSPLHTAVYGNAREVALLLIKHGATGNTKNKDGSTPLAVAFEQGNKDVAMALIAHGAGVNARDNNGRTLLHVAAMQKNAKDILDALIAGGANIQAQDRNGWTPLHIAAENNAKDVAETLIAAGANVHAKGRNGDTPLHIATGKNAKGVAAVLRENGAVR